MQSFRTWIELDASAFNHNIDQISSLLSASQLGIVVKANAYGHGLIPISVLLQAHPKVAWLFTADLEEALTLRQAGVTKPILALAYCPSDPELLKEAVINKIHITVNSIDSVLFIQKIARRHKQQALIHLKIDTGLSRLGAIIQEAYTVAQAVIKNSSLSLEGLFSHLADTSNPDDTYTLKQIALFLTCQRDLQEQGIRFKYTHILSSGALTLESSLCNSLASEVSDSYNSLNYSLDQSSIISVRASSEASFSKRLTNALKKLNHNQAMYQMPQSIVRVGTIAYGHWKSPINQHRITSHKPSCSLRPVLSWKTRIIQLKKIYKQTLAILPIGYGDGYPSALSCKAHVLVAEQYAPIVGFVDINSVAIDVTAIPAAQINSEVTLIGASPLITVSHLAQLKDGLHNELLCGIHPEIPRIVVPIDHFSKA